MMASETSTNPQSAIGSPLPSRAEPLPASGLPSAGDADLLARYVREVGRQLPKRERADVEAELRSLLEEMLAERAAAAVAAGELGRQEAVVDTAGPSHEASARATAADVARPAHASEALTIALLREFGRPELVAERYGQPRRSLIGPALYPTYLLVLKIALGIVTVVYVASLALWLGFGGPASSHMLGALNGGDGEWLAKDLFRTLWRTAQGYVGTVLTNVGLITAIVAVLELKAPRDVAADAGEWDPRDLPRIEDPDRLDRGDLVVETCFLVALLVLFNVILRWQGPLIYLNDGTWRLLGRFTPDLLAFVPWLNALWIGELGLNLYVLGRGRWNPATRWMDIAINTGTLVVLALILRQPELVDIRALSMLFRLGLVVVWIFVAIELAQQVWRRLRSAQEVAVG